MRSYTTVVRIAFGDTVSELQQSAVEQARELCGESIALYHVRSWQTYRPAVGGEFREWLRMNPQDRSDKKLWRSFTTVDVQVPEDPLDWLRVLFRDLREKWTLL